MNKATQQNYIKHFGPDAFVPGYCGKCPGAGKIENDPVCMVYADDPAPRILPDEHGCNEPPDWCPIRHISRRPLLTKIQKLESDRKAAILFLKSITFNDGDAGDKLMQMLRAGAPDRDGLKHDHKDTGDEQPVTMCKTHGWYEKGPCKFCVGEMVDHADNCSIYDYVPRGCNCGAVDSE